MNASLDKLRVGIGIESDKIILPILGESDKTFFDCNLTMGALNISANLQSETIPLVVSVVMEERKKRRGEKKRESF